MILSRKAKKILTLIIVFSLSISVNASYIFIPMDENQQNHLKAYGIAYYAIERDIKVDWLLNYQGGSFLIKQNLDIEKECKLRNVSYNIIADIQSTIILQSISSPEVNLSLIHI